MTTFLALRHGGLATGEAIANVIIVELKDIMPSTWAIRWHLISVGCDGAGVLSRMIGTVFEFKQ